VADIDLSAITRAPSANTTASIGTTWQSFTLPAWCRRCTVTFESAAGYIGFDRMGFADAESPADGGAVGTHRQPSAADSPLSFTVGKDPGTGLTPTTQIFLAAVSGTVTATVFLETWPD